MSRILVAGILCALSTPAIADAPARDPAPPSANTVKLERVIVQDKLSTVEADTRDFETAVHRAEVLRRAWDRAVAGNHVKDAGRYAILHAHALRDVRITKATLERHRSEMYTARERLVADEFALQHRAG